MRDMFLDALDLRAAPPRKPPPPPAKPVKLGGDNDDGNASGHDDYDPSNMELMRDAVRSIHEQVNEPRPDFADDIDRLVAAMVNAGDIVFDKHSGEYRAPHYRCFRFGE